MTCCMSLFLFFFFFFFFFQAEDGIRDTSVTEFRRVLFRSWGYVPVAAGSGEEALDLLGDQRFALSLIAIRLPGMSGIEFLRRAEDLAGSGSVIMIADSGHSAQIVEAIQAGADDFIRRPYTAEDLESAIRTVSGRPRREPAAPAA